ncbi:MAG: 6-carboxytetrahydropterin synthase [Cyclobacteriaceae bacterium]
MSKTVLVSRKEHFNAAHKLYNPKWDNEKNMAVFGPCANENWHGHNFDLIVTIKGPIDVNTGFVVDLKALSDLIKTTIINQLDHKNLNLDVDFMKDKMASCENIVIGIWEILAAKISELNPEAALYKVVLHETRNNHVEYLGSNPS